MARGAKSKDRTLAQALGQFLEKRMIPDLRARVEAHPNVQKALDAALARERSAGRTADDAIAFRERLLEQVGAAWLLNCVFVRFLEDRALVEHRRIAGDGAADAQDRFGHAFPGLAGNAREYLLAVFRECARLPGAREVLGPKNNVAYRLGPSAAVAAELIALFREQDAGGALAWRFDSDDTRVLGDLYQDLSKSVKERYALLQTPDFVEAFILERTLDPAVKDFKLEGLRVIDPTCGSGHFLLGAFERLRAMHQRAEPGADDKRCAGAALAHVYGVDLNPYAVAISRFRLLVAYVRAAKIARLREAPADLALDQHVVVADSLLYGGKTPALAESLTSNEARRAWGGDMFVLDDVENARALFRQRYHAVVGNPPYIVCKDAALRETYRRKFPDSATGKYALAAPFTERFFELAEDRGYVGLINANSFMKREFGKGLIEKVLPRFDLTEVVDTSGAYIPGHGTPTVILLGRNRRRTGDDLTPHPPLPFERGGAEEEGSGVVHAQRYVDPALVEAARRARKEPTPAEAAAWELLRDRRTLGLKFRRQQVIEGVRADFYCPALRLVVELDGGVHLDPDQRAYDAARTKVLEAWGLRVVRLKNEQVSQDTLTRLLTPLARQGEGGRGGEVATVRVVMGRRGEPETPDDPAKGKVWSSIAQHDDEVGFENEFITVADVSRETLAKHPWSLGGGGASDLKELLEQRCEKKLGEIADSIGIASVTGEDDLYVLPEDVMVRLGVRHHRPLLIGELLRDWASGHPDHCIFPYNEHLTLYRFEELGRESELLWSARSLIRHRRRFGVPMIQRGATWYELQELYRDKLKTPFAITFAFVATHNHFILERGGKIFKQSAPIVKLPAQATEDDHLALLAWLNSSTACFWLKQVCQSKANHTDDRPEKGLEEMNRFEFSGTAVGDCPVPAKHQLEILLHFACEIKHINTQDAGCTAERTAVRVRDEAQAAARLVEEAEASNGRLRRQRIAVQENLDWRVYSLFGLCDEAAGRAITFPDGLDTDARLFVRSSPPEGLSQEDLMTWERRRVALESSRVLQMIESPANKRRWIGVGRGSFALQARTYREEVEDAARALVLDAIEKEFGREGRVRSLVDLHAAVARDAGLVRLLLFLTGDRDSSSVLGEMLAAEAVPFHATMRFTDAGLEKRAAWELTWDLQRREDAGETLSEPIPVPPKYDREDYLDGRYWSLRGKLDVPRERFISYPFATTDDAPSPLYGWAGWDHKQRADALTALYLRRKDDDGWKGERLAPLLAGLLELIPWLKQWHNTPGDGEDQGAGDAYAAFVESEARELGVTFDELRAWRPPEKREERAAARARRAKPVATQTTITDAGEGAEGATETVAKKRGRRKKAAEEPP